MNVKRYKVSLNQCVTEAVDISLAYRKTIILDGDINDVSFIRIKEEFDKRGVSYLTGINGHKRSEVYIIHSFQLEVSLS